MVEQGRRSTEVRSQLFQHWRTWQIHHSNLLNHFNDGCQQSGCGLFLFSPNGCGSISRQTLDDKWWWHAGHKKADASFNDWLLQVRVGTETTNDDDLSNLRRPLSLPHFDLHPPPSCTSLTLHQCQHGVHPSHEDARKVTYAMWTVGHNVYCWQNDQNGKQDQYRLRFVTEVIGLQQATFGRNRAHCPRFEWLINRLTESVTIRSCQLLRSANSGNTRPITSRIGRWQADSKDATSIWRIARVKLNLSAADGVMTTVSWRQTEYPWNVRWRPRPTRDTAMAPGTLQRKAAGNRLQFWYGFSGHALKRKLFRSKLTKKVRLNSSSCWIISKLIQSEE